MSDSPSLEGISAIPSLDMCEFSQRPFRITPYHLTGISSLCASTAGIPRIKELLNISKKQKTPTFVINFIAGPGSGKTTICSLVFAHLKIKKYTVEYVQEYAKMLVWTKKFHTLNNQYYVTSKQYNILKSIDTNVNMIVTDGPIIHGLYYNRHNKDNTSNIEKTEEFILENIMNLIISTYF